MEVWSPAASSYQHNQRRSYPGDVSCTSFRYAAAGAYASAKPSSSLLTVPGALVAPHTLVERQTNAHCPSAPPPPGYHFPTSVAPSPQPLSPNPSNVLSPLPVRNVVASYALKSEAAESHVSTIGQTPHAAAADTSRHQLGVCGSDEGTPAMLPFQESKDANGRMNFAACVKGGRVGHHPVDAETCLSLVWLLCLVSITIQDLQDRTALVRWLTSVLLSPPSVSFQGLRNLFIHPSVYAEQAVLSLLLRSGRWCLSLLELSCCVLMIFKRKNIFFAWLWCLTRLCYVSAVGGRRDGDSTLLQQCFLVTLLCVLTSFLHRFKCAQLYGYAPYWNSSSNQRGEESCRRATSPTAEPEALPRVNPKSRNSTSFWVSPRSTVRWLLSLLGVSDLAGGVIIREMLGSSVQHLQAREESEVRDCVQSETSIGSLALFTLTRRVSEAAVLKDVSSTRASSQLGGSLLGQRSRGLAKWLKDMALGYSSCAKSEGLATADEVHNQSNAGPSVLCSQVRHRRVMPAPPPVDLVMLLSTCVSVELSVLYGLLAFHKLNVDYFYARTSCASHATALLMSQYLRLSPSSTFVSLALWLSPTIRVSVEAVLCGLFAWEGTRRLAVAVGLIYHFVDSWAQPPVVLYPFLLTLLPMYGAVAPQSFGRGLSHMLGRTLALPILCAALLHPLMVLLLPMLSSRESTPDLDEDAVSWQMFYWGVSWSCLVSVFFLIGIADDWSLRCSQAKQNLFGVLSTAGRVVSCIADRRVLDLGGGSVDGANDWYYHKLLALSNRASQSRYYHVDNRREGYERVANVGDPMLGSSICALADVPLAVQSNSSADEGTVVYNPKSHRGSFSAICGGMYYSGSIKGHRNSSPCGLSTADAWLFRRSPDDTLSTAAGSVSPMDLSSTRSLSPAVSALLSPASAVCASSPASVRSALDRRHGMPVAEAVMAAGCEGVSARRRLSAAAVAADEELKHASAKKVEEVSWGQSLQTLVGAHMLTMYCRRREAGRKGGSAAQGSAPVSCSSTEDLSAIEQGDDGGQRYELTRKETIQRPDKTTSRKSALWRWWGALDETEGTAAAGAGGRVVKSTEGSLTKYNYTDIDYEYYSSSVRSRGLAVGLFGSAMLLFCGLTPYLGLRTTPAFTAWTNLRVSQSPNHFMFKNRLWTKLTRVADEALLVRQTSVPALAQYQVNLFELYSPNTAAYLAAAGVDTLLLDSGTKNRHWSQHKFEFRPFHIPLVELQRALNSAEAADSAAMAELDWMQHESDGVVARNLLFSREAGGKALLFHNGKEQADGRIVWHSIPEEDAANTQLLSQLTALPPGEEILTETDPGALPADDQEARRGGAFRWISFLQATTQRTLTKYVSVDQGSSGACRIS